MIGTYLHLNVALTVGWLFFYGFQFVKVSFRSKVSVARAILSSALLSVLIFTFVPETLLPQIFSKTLAELGREVDSTKTLMLEPTRIVLSKSSGLTVKPKRKIELLTLWPMVFFLGLFISILNLFRNWLQLSELLSNNITLHRVGHCVVAVSSAVAIPFASFFRGRAYVVLPASLLPFAKDFRTALQHEIEHHRRGDTQWVIALEWIVCIFYLNPFAFLWRNSISKIQELACDESLISQMRVSKHDYGSCLLTVAEMALTNRKMYGGTTCMNPGYESNGHSFLIRRIKMFEYHERTSIKKWQGRVLGTLLGSAIFGVAFVANAALRSDSAPNPGTPEFNTEIQTKTERILSQGIEKYRATAGFAIVADPSTGVVLASANINRGFDNSLAENWALSYPLQPASAVKPLILASALEAQKIHIDDMHDCENGRYDFARRTIEDHKAFNALSSAETIVQSSNICSIKLAQKLGATGVENGLRAFGIGGPEVTKSFPSARHGHLPSANHADADKYIADMAHGTSEKAEFYISPLELVQAYGAIANGGRLMMPIEANGSHQPEVIREVLSQQTAVDLQSTLRAVVVSGTGQAIKTSPISLAGKTSTMDIANNRRITGFIGYAPADNPKLVAYVVLFDLKGKHRSGSDTAAPVFREVIEAALSTL